MSGEARHSETLETVSHGPEETQAVGRLLGQRAIPGDLFLLTGDLGAGKTTLTQGVLWGLGGEEFARSPTFVLVSEYRGRLPMYHVDLYRLDRIEDIADLGLDEYLYGDGVCVVEWAEKGTPVFPEEHLAITLERAGDTSRRLSFTAHGQRYRSLLRDLKASLPSK